MKTYELERIHAIRTVEMLNDRARENCIVIEVRIGEESVFTQRFYDPDPDLIDDYHQVAVKNFFSSLGKD